MPNTEYRSFTAMAPEQLNGAELQEYGKRHFADLDYRIRVGELLSQAVGADHAVVFDDTQLAVPENQRHKLHGIPGYERALFPGLMLAPSFKDGVKVLVGAPPNPAEIEGIHAHKTALEEKLGKPVKYGVYFETEGGLKEAIDYALTDPAGYQQECRTYAGRMNDQEVVHAIPADHQIGIFNRHKTELLDGKRSLVWPFQVTDVHQRAFAQDVEDGTIVLPDMPEIDKAYNNYLLRENGFHDVPQMHVVGGNGQLIESFDELMSFQSQNVREPKTDASVETFAQGIVSAVNRLGQEGKRGYIKLDSNGVSGLTNVDPSVCPEAYDPSVPEPVRIARLKRFILDNLDEDVLPPAAVVEEFIEAKQHEGVVWDGTVCGMLVDGQFYPTSVNPFLTQNAEYVSQWNASSAEEIGETPEDWDRMYDTFSRMGKVLAEKAGYKNGILAGDIFKGTDGRMLVHDFNFRRGGRSTPEVLITLEPGGWFENQSIIPLPAEQAALTNEELFDIYTAVCRGLQEQGIQPFATAFGYFSKKGDEVKLKIKTMTPTHILTEQGLPRSEHKGTVDDIVAAHVSANIA